MIKVLKKRRNHSNESQKESNWTKPKKKRICKYPKINPEVNQLAQSIYEINNNLTAV